MMLATLKVRRQLAETGDVVRWASIVAGPREFWTITVWRSRHDMQEFMRSGAHDDTMWNFSKWLESFWLMRWRPGPEEMGRWKGLSMAQAEPVYQESLDSAPRGGDEGRENLERALEHLPRLRASMGANGAVGYDNTAYARRRRAEVGGAGGVVVHIPTTVAGTLDAIGALRGLKRRAGRDPDMLRAVVGMSRPGHLYLLSVWRDRAAARRFLRSGWLADLAKRWDGLWANEWFPENEFGHWDGLRLRRVKQHYSIDMPKAVVDLGEVVEPG